MLKNQMDKLTLLRQLHQQLPTLAENIIIRWGGADLDGHIDELLVNASRAKPPLTSDTVAALQVLRDLHIAEFPQFASLTIVAITNQLADNSHFKIINDRFRHIGSRVIATWGHATFYQYLEDLFADSRAGQRKGFPEEVGLAIFRLSQQHDETFPKLAAGNTDVWSQYQ